MGQIQISSPFLKSITHSDFNVTATTGATKQQILTPSANVGEKRVVVIIQNKASSAKLTVIGNATDTVGIEVTAGSTLKLDNYNGGLWAFGSAAVNTGINISAV
ncbi:hypothetical protein UFOVP157_11 [uncultured Caudovirales phage]|uniref:Uncharacterized protein n=1 Tax=uncultured Caudovirales phage TaxID=2100421 RepID=A0A6J7W8W6_9CAUD|nr:hypothetical protein UFOVP157_11 [uncultured Caudovirales phage]